MNPEWIIAISAVASGVTAAFASLGTTYLKGKFAADSGVRQAKKAAEAEFAELFREERTARASLEADRLALSGRVERAEGHVKALSKQVEAGQAEIDELKAEVLKIPSHVREVIRLFLSLNPGVTPDHAQAEEFRVAVGLRGVPEHEANGLIALRGMISQ